jgi:Arc/MetJ family transcription regulator
MKRPKSAPKTGIVSRHPRNNNLALHTLPCVDYHTTKARCPIATNLDLDDKLIAEAVKLGKFRSKKEAVSTALVEYVQRHKQARILEMAGKVTYYADYDYKKLRSRKTK